MAAGPSSGAGGPLTGRAGRQTETPRVPVPAASHCPPAQAVTIITYKEPENPEYQPFLARLKEEALAHFNFSMKDGLVGCGAVALGKLGGVGLRGAQEGAGADG